LAAVGLVTMTRGTTSVSTAGGCGMQLNDAPIAFCETFDAPFPVTNRSGQLNGTLWGVSRITGNMNPSGLLDAWAPSTIQACGGSQPAEPDATDVIVCNGQLRESMFDHGVATIAMYPKQPFDFAGRTGTVAFDVTNDTSGSHGVWPEFWLSDQPVPAPFSHNFQPCDNCSYPRNGFGIRFSAQEGACPGGWRAESVVVVRNYVPDEASIFGGSGSGLSISDSGCASMSSGPNGGLNHIELRINQNQVDIYASNAGSSSLHLINRITNANLTLTRGLIWLEDSRYNPAKSARPETVVHTFAWDNVAFDGPAPYRDLSFDVLDSLTRNSDGTINLGWTTLPTSPMSLNTLPMTAGNISAATSSLLMFNFWSTETVTSITYRINGHSHTVPVPFSASSYVWHSLAVPVTLTDLVAGPQAIGLSGTSSMIIANVNIVLIAAAPVPGIQPPVPPAAPSNVRIIP
jgi:hypothetical protein